MVWDCAQFANERQGERLDEHSAQEILCFNYSILFTSRVGMRKLRASCMNTIFFYYYYLRSLHLAQQNFLFCFLFFVFFFFQKNLFVCLFVCFFTKNIVCEKRPHLAGAPGAGSPAPAPPPALQLALFAVPSLLTKR